jgi:hypothetical protein
LEPIDDLIKRNSAIVSNNVMNKGREEVKKNLVIILDLIK